MAAKWATYFLVAQEERLLAMCDHVGVEDDQAPPNKPALLGRGMAHRGHTWKVPAVKEVVKQLLINLPSVLAVMEDIAANNRILI